MILLDSNILIRLANSKDPLNQHVEQLLRQLQSQADSPLCIIPQNLYESWCVASRPIKNNGLDFTSAQILSLKNNFKQVFQFLPDPPPLYDEWEHLVIHYHCQGTVCHDAQLVAAMFLHGIRRLLTFNTADFARFQDRIEVMDATPVPLA